jgi:hypothetical protein
MKRARSVKVVASGALMLAILVGAELSQAVAEGFLVREEDHMHSLVNGHRSAHRMHHYGYHPALQMVARRQAQRMAAAGYIYHTPNLAAEAGSAVPNWVRIGENVGVGPSVVSVEDAFLASPPHHANIDNVYSVLGVGAVAGPRGALFFTQNFAQLGGPPPPPPPPPPAAIGAPPPPSRVCRRRGRRIVCRRVRRARRAGRRVRGVRRARVRRSRVRGVEVFRTDDPRAQGKSNVNMVRAVGGMLSFAADKATFWD